MSEAKSPFTEARSQGGSQPPCEEIANAIRTLLSSLSPEEREQVLHALLPRSAAIPKAGEVLSFVARVIAEKKKEVTVAEVKHELASAGVPAKPKEIYNALGYLTRKRFVRRVNYGRYIVDGNYIETADDLGAEPARYED